MIGLLSLILVSFFTVAVLSVPFINLLYKIKFQRQNQQTRDMFNKRTPIFDKFHAHKAGTPLGGGVLVVFSVVVLFLLVGLVREIFSFESTSVYPYAQEVFIILFSVVSFAVLGLVDDVRKTFQLKKASFFGLRFRQKILIQIVLALFISSYLYFVLKIDIVNLRFIDVFHIGPLFIPFATLVIVSFVNAVNIADGLDGLAGGLLLIALVAFLMISSSILDTTLSAFLGLWIGALIAFLYFNIYPARIWMGDAGALGFGAGLAITGLLLGKTPALAIICGMFVVEVASSLIQLLSKKFLHRKVFEAAPLHLYLQNKGWPEPKIVMRFWLAGILLAVMGLLLAFLG